MTEIERAISAIGIALAQEPPAIVEDGYGFYLVIEDALAPALAALREQAERDKGCEWCDEFKHDWKYCGECGKRLEVEP